MKRMIQRCLGLAAMLTLALALTVSASAAETAGVTVQLNGQNVAFTDAAPTIQDGRTMIPMRAVFEALGAEVSYDGAARTVTGVRGGTTVTMTIGQTEVQVREGESTRTFTMDVAPYVDAATGRTYVPVRFAAEALGCSVGWDADDRTVLIADVDALVEAAGPFTLMDKVMASQSAETQGNQKLDGTFTGKMTIQDAEAGTSYPISLTGDYSALGSTAATEMAMNMSLDVSALESMMAEAGDETTAAVLEQFKDLKMNLIMDLENGTLYMNSALLNGMLLGVTESADAMWIKFDTSALMDEMGMSELTAQTAEVKTAELLAEVLRAVPLTDKDSDWAGLQSTAALFGALLGDNAFVQDGDNYVCKYAMTLPVEGESMAVDYNMTLTMKDDVLENMTLTASVDMGTQGKLSLNASGVGAAAKVDMTMALADQLAMTMQIEVTETKLNMDMTMDLAGELTIELHMDGTQAATTDAPAAEPPADAQVVDLVQMLTAAGSAAYENAA